MLEIGEIQKKFKLDMANPIYNKVQKQEEPRAIFKFEYAKNQIKYKGGNKKVRQDEKKRRGEEGEEEEEEGEKVYQKFENRSMNILKEIQYKASLFLQKRDIMNNTREINDVETLIRQFNSSCSPSQCPTIETMISSEVTFNSNFESGNLFSVVKRNTNQYDLTLQNDINSKGNTQWFNFSVSNLPKGVQVTFNILNLLKSDSLFNYGMQPVVFSRLRNKQTGEGWRREGKDIAYYRSNQKRQDSKKSYYSMSFKISTKFQGDTLQIAHCFPYTYTMLQKFIINIEKHLVKKQYFHHEILFKTPLMHNIDLFTITSQNKKQKKIILIMARQHPGESQSSYICEGLISYLLSKNDTATFLRQNYIIKIIPMVNPDGIIFGNYRTNIFGVDLNRKWVTEDNELSPETGAIIKHIQKLNKGDKIRIVIDIHGHSRKLGSFFYGNPNQQQPQQTRLFPFICSKLSKQVIFNDCTFSISSSKKKSARVFLYQKLGIKNVYTYETSFYGYRKQGKIVPFGIDDYKKLGVNLCDGLFSMLQPETDPSIINKYKNELINTPGLLRIGNEQDDSGSDSRPQQCQLDPIQFDEINNPEFCNNELSENTNSQYVQKILANRLEKIIRQQYKNIQSAENQTKNGYHIRKKIKSVLPVNKINSKAPNRYDLVLEPIISPNIKIKTTQRINRSFKEIRNQYAKVNMYTQTSQTIQFVEQDYSINLAQHHRYNKSFSMTPGTVKRTLILKMDVTPKLTSFFHPPAFKTSTVATQTPVSNSSNLLNYSPCLVRQNSLQILAKSLHKNSSHIYPTKTLPRLSNDQRPTDLLKKRNNQTTIHKKLQDVEKSLNVKKKHIFQNRSFSKK